MKKVIIIAAVAILLVILAANSLYTVAENEYACVVEFSKIVATNDQPGLHFKVPFLHSVKYFSNATQLYDIPPSEVITLDTPKSCGFFSRQMPHLAEREGFEPSCA